MVRVDSKHVHFSGVVVSFEEGEDKVLYIQGSINEENTAFYLLVPEEVYRKYAVSGIGKWIEGEGVVVSENPPTVKCLKVE